MSRACPRCESPLEPRQSGGVEVDLCGSCGGVFLDEGEFDRLIAERFVGKRMESTFAFVAEAVDDPVPCSGCGQAMNRTEFDEIELDRCPDCGGIWLDGDERRAFADRAQDSARSREPEAVVTCGGCGAHELQRLCIRRMDQFYCEACVVAGNHPGREAQLVGSRDLVANAARSFASAKANQNERREDLARRKKIREATHSRTLSRGTITDPLLFDTVEMLVRRIINAFRRRD